MAKHTILVIAVVIAVVVAMRREEACAETLNFYPLSIGYKMPYYSGKSTLQQQNPQITTIITVNHGTDRNANDYYCYMSDSLESYYNGKIPDNVFVWAPKYLINTDMNNTFKDSIYWDDNEGWKEGDNSTSDYSKSMGSYAVIDEIFVNVIQSRIFPNLKTIIVAGHSAGGQTTHRYAMTSPIVELFPSLKFFFFPANPSSFVYMDNTRAALPEPQICNYCDASDILKNGTIKWGVPSAGDCFDYNDWKYGLEGDANPYVRQKTPQQLIQQYIQRSVTYLSGTADVCDSAYINDSCNCDDSDLDTGCEALTQGLCRLQRGIIYFDHVMKISSGKANHVMVTVAGVAHDAAKMFSSPEGQNAIFSKITM